MTQHARSTLATLLEEGLRTRPDDPAIIDLDRSHSFRELQSRATAIATHLWREHGVRTGDRIVVAVAKSPLIVPIAVACWMLGAIYVPVDPESPVQRMATILDSIEPVVVIGPQTLMHAWQTRLSGRRQVSYEALLALESIDTTPPEEAVDPDSAAVIIHTSGSTGTPKGVVLSHASVLIYLRNHNAFLGFDQASVGMNNGPFYFDVSIQDTFLPLYFGASVLFHRGLWVSPLVIGLIQTYRVTHLIAVSSILELVSKDVARMQSLATSALRVVVTGGEVCPPRLINRWLETIPGLRVLYGYGPTEVNSLCTTYVITRPEHDRTEMFPIGKPFPGHHAVLVGDDGQVIEGPAAVGTLAVGGPQLMIGYWKDPELTARTTYTHRGERYYLTGDRCHRDADGNYCFDGRLDTEVKIRGRRINLNEVRNALVACEDVAHAVVSVAEAGDEKRIVAAVHVARPRPDAEAALRRWLADRVPDYMVPWHIGVFVQPPRTATDKIDERRMRETLHQLAQGNPGQRDFRISD